MDRPAKRCRSARLCAVEFVVRFLSKRQASCAALVCRDWRHAIRNGTQKLRITERNVGCDLAALAPRCTKIYIREEHLADVKWSSLAATLTKVTIMGSSLQPRQLCVLEALPLLRVVSLLELPVVSALRLAEILPGDACAKLHPHTSHTFDLVRVNLVLRWQPNFPRIMASSRPVRWPTNEDLWIGELQYNGLPLLWHWLPQLESLSWPKQELTAEISAIIHRGITSRLRMLDLVGSSSWSAPVNTAYFFSAALPMRQRMVRLDRSHQSDQDLEKLACTALNLRVLNLDDGCFTSKGLAHVGRLSALRCLRLDGGTFDDAALLQLTHLRHLFDLYIGSDVSPPSRLPRLDGWGLTPIVARLEKLQLFARVSSIQTVLQACKELRVLGLHVEGMEFPSLIHLHRTLAELFAVGHAHPDDIETLSGLTNLRRLHLRRVEIYPRFHWRSLTSLRLLERLSLPKGCEVTTPLESPPPGLRDHI